MIVVHVVVFLDGITLRVIKHAVSTYIYVYRKTLYI